MGTEPKKAVSHTRRSLDIDLAWFAVLDIGESQKWSDVEPDHRKARMLPTIEPQDLVFIVSDEDPICVDWNGGGTVARADMERAPEAAPLGRCVEERVVCRQIVI